MNSTNENLLTTINDSLLAVIGSINGVLWGHVLVYLLVGVGIYFSLRLGFIQIRQFRHAIDVLKSGRDLENGISSYQVFCTSMAARVGTGNMAGIAVALSVGGPGAIFWMWVIALFGMATAFIESTLAQVYKVKDVDGQYRGGPAYYMEKGLGKRWMGTLFSVCLIIAFGFVFNAVQANTITDALHHSFGFNETTQGIVIVICSAFFIMGGLKRVASASAKIVPIMAVGYLAIAIVIVLMNITELPAVLSLIVKSAFGWQEAAAGGVAFTISQAMQTGIARGLFSNEAGMGSAANIAASATPNPNHPASQGFVQMLGVFVDTIVICTASAAMIMLSGVMDMPDAGKGISLLQTALSHELGGWTTYFIAAAILLFCFSSIIANYSYAETNIMFLNGNTKKGLMIFRLCVLAMVMFGSVASLPVVWNLADASMGLMAFVNIVALIFLSKLAIRVIKDYEHQLKQGKTPEFDRSKFPELEDIEGAWHPETIAKARRKNGNSFAN
ncbi:alanine/glycine:cation symporter family protein [Photobacterium leiognathi]|uniref:Amino acid carrier family protein n=3 Tax=Photobacterium leiognathi TaxID=553611 RepID=A0A0U1P5L9_PHOLE|nr:alanine/glycine:cation symporter family protein [Photobacterium leiognathi]KJF89115.1 sodium:alanine symporter [Photobacterium leiognathi]KJF98286.1 sodium:alanine symporter [Photobacterium leiognathi]MCG3887311.1 alanine:cation symporter family protein [Photobacterium leiognathi]PSV13412.1 alanine:cation symporter family protein [Photobacterium leiognathi subsp. mandapamensis]PSV79568.1 alanine:cation symporter family protein [Photobacterium leiognathi]